MAVVLDLVRRVDARHGLELLHLPVGRRGAHGDALAGPEAGGEALDVVGLLPGQAERRARSAPGRNCSGSTPMPTRLLRWMRS